MLRLVPMTQADFLAYSETANAEYAQDHVRSGRWSAEEALAHAVRDYQQLLPAGLATPNHYLYTLHDDATDSDVGMLWFAIREEAGQRSAFVYDMHVFPAFQRRGYASQAFQALEQQAHALGLTQLALHVFAHNHAARALYEKLGFVVTNIVMTKLLTHSSSSS
jgi:ribosomal protein S18 acetylase RimI-like enzyme